LWKGAHIRKANGSYGLVIGLDLVQKLNQMYNLTVEKAHTFFVGKLQWLVHNTCDFPRRSGGYKTYDVDSYEKLSNQRNRAYGFENIVQDNNIQAHHPIQDKWARINVSGYKSDLAPAILLETGKDPITGELRAHSVISKMQSYDRDARNTTTGTKWSTSLRQEFNSGYRRMLNAKVPPEFAKKSIKKAYIYFKSIGGNFD
jgi:hypothetical protein